MFLPAAQRSQLVGSRTARIAPVAQVRDGQQG